MRELTSYDVFVDVDDIQRACPTNICQTQLCTSVKMVPANGKEILTINCESRPCTVFWIVEHFHLPITT